MTKVKQPKEFGVKNDKRLKRLRRDFSRAEYIAYFYVRLKRNPPKDPILALAELMADRARKANRLEAEASKKFLKVREKGIKANKDRADDLKRTLRTLMLPFFQRNPRCGNERLYKEIPPLVKEQRAYKLRQLTDSTLKRHIGTVAARIREDIKAVTKS